MQPEGKAGVLINEQIPIYLNIQKEEQVKERVKAFRICILMLTTLFVPAAAHSELSAALEKFKDVHTLIQNLIDAKGVVSITIAVAKDGETLWELGLGWADR